MKTNRKFPLILLLFLLACSTDHGPESKFLRGRILILGDSITHTGIFVSFLEYELARKFPETEMDIVAIGLSSETVSCQTESDREFPRPCVHERLDSALEKLKPDVVFSCYGMNDGLYTTQNPENMQAYQNGITKLMEKVFATGAKLVLLTPPPSDPLAAKEKVPCSDSVGYNYFHPYCHYDSVLADYANWTMTLKNENLATIDLNAVMSGLIREQRKTDSTFVLSPDGVHPDSAGHWLMARTILNALGVDSEKGNFAAVAAEKSRTPLFKKIDERRTILSDAWRVAVGHTHQRKWEGLPVDEANRKATALRTEIRALLRTE